MHRNNVMMEMKEKMIFAIIPACLRSAEEDFAAMASFNRIVMNNAMQVYAMHLRHLSVGQRVHLRYVAMAYKMSVNSVMMGMLFQRMDALHSASLKKDPSPKAPRIPRL